MPAALAQVRSSLHMHQCNGMGKTYQEEDQLHRQPRHSLLTQPMRFPTAEVQYRAGRFAPRDQEDFMQPKAASPAQTLEQLIALLSAHRDDLASRYHLRSLGIFGSYVRGEQRPESDIDVLADFTVTPSLFTLTALEDELSAVLGAPIDLAVKSVLRPHIGARILSEVVIV